MPALALDSALNLLWLAIGIGCLCLLAWFERKHHRHAAWRPRLMRTIAMLAITVSLFPCVSGSDDEVSLFTLFHSGQRGANTPLEDSKEKTMQHLARLLDVIESYQIAGVWSFVITLCFLMFVVVVRPIRIDCHLIFATGRAPPIA
jgi:hypothetical protein